MGTHTLCAYAKEEDLSGTTRTRKDCTLASLLLCEYQLFVGYYYCYCKQGSIRGVGMGILQRGVYAQSRRFWVDCDSRSLLRQRSFHWEGRRQRMEHHKRSDVKVLCDKTLVEDGSRLSWQRGDVSVVLVHPQIPQNCGNIARTCAATGVGLHLVGPMGFVLDDKKLKRAGLDYWDWVAVNVHEDMEAFLSFYKGLDGDTRLFAYSKFGNVHYAQEGLYQGNARNFLMFGAETTGLPEEAHEASSDIVQIPMGNYTHVRSLNLATSVGIGLFESLRQLDGTTILHTMQSDTSC